MPTNDEVNELHKEWRAIVLAKLNSLETGQKDTQKDITDVKTTVAKMSDQSSELATLREKVEKLESLKSKLVGAWFATTTIGSLVGWLISTLFKG